MNLCMGCMAQIPDGATTCPHCGYVRGTAPREAYHLVPETILKGRYIVGRVLGYGGFGVTYIGYDAQLERIVAIKEFLPSTFATRMPGNTQVTVYNGAATEQFGAGLSRFVEEAQTLAQFNGIPGIVDIYDSFEGNNTAYIVMQFLRGQDVKDILAAAGPMPYEQARDIILKVCDTLAPVHERGIIHRDLSPDNIYLTTDGEVKLLDFGAARYESAVNSKSLSVILKSGYAPEEQYRSRGDQGPWTDVYALAATFYKMLTGATPPDSMERAINDEIKEPSKHGVQVPQSAENAIMNALNIRKSDRTQSVTAFKEALLADGVERVKVKPRRADAGKVPTWAKVALGASALAIVAFGLLTLTGVFDFGQGNLLASDFGDAAVEGHVIVPAVTGKSEAEAARQLEKIGLKVGASTFSFDRTMDRGTVSAQDPEPGSQIEEGSEVVLTVSAGGLIEAFEDGYVENPVGMPIAQFEAFIRNCDNSDGANYEFQYSDTVPANHICGYEWYTYENEYSSGGYTRIFISAGPDNVSSPNGELRGAYLINYGEGAVRTGVAVGGNLEDGKVRETVAVSTGSGDWIEVGGTNYTHSYYEHDEMLEYNGAPGNGIDFGRELAFKHPELAGQPLTVEVRRYSAENTLVDSLRLDQTYTFDFTDTPVEADDWEMMTVAELQEMYEAGYFADSHRIEDLFENEYHDEETLKRITPYRIKGNFTATNYPSYYVYRNDDTYGDNFRCIENGELIIYLNDGGEEYREPSHLRIFAYGEITWDAEGNMLSRDSKAGTLSLSGVPEGGIDVTGLSAGEAIARLKSEIPGSRDYYLEGVATGSVPAGTVYGWRGSPEEAASPEKYTYIYIKVATGESGVEPTITPVGFKPGSSGWSEFVGLVATGSAHQTLVVEYSQSVDGATWLEDEKFEQENHDYGSAWSSMSFRIDYRARISSGLEAAERAIAEAYEKGELSNEEAAKMMDQAIESGNESSTDKAMGRIRILDTSGEVLAEYIFDFVPSSEADLPEGVW